MLNASLGLINVTALSASETTSWGSNSRPPLDYLCTSCTVVPGVEKINLKSKNRGLLA